MVCLELGKMGCTNAPLPGSWFSVPWVGIRLGFLTEKHVSQTSGMVGKPLPRANGLLNIPIPKRTLESSGTAKFDVVSKWDSRRGGGVGPPILP